MESYSQVARGGYAQCTKLLVASGAKVDAESLYGLTPAMVAVIEGHRRVLRILLEANCDIARLDPFKTKTNKKFVTILEMLMLAGANIDWQVGLVMSRPTLLIGGESGANLDAIVSLVLF